jgi:hypothetical protein
VLGELRRNYLTTSARLPSNYSFLAKIDPQGGEGVRHGKHDHMIIGRNEIGVQHMIKVFAQELGVALA